MKKKILILLPVVAMMFALASCDSKLCYCYERTSMGVQEVESYTNTDTPCNALSTSSRTCVERQERMNPGDIAWATRK